MNINNFKTDEKVKLAKECDDYPNDDMVGRVLNNKAPYEVIWEDGSQGKYNTLDLVKDTQEEKPKKVLPFKVVDNSTDNSTGEDEKESVKDYINQFFDDYKDYFDDIVIVGSAGDKMELFFAGVDPQEAYWQLNSAALQLMTSVNSDPEDFD